MIEAVKWDRSLKVSQNLCRVWASMTLDIGRRLWATVLLYLHDHLLPH